MSNASESENLPGEQENSDLSEMSIPEVQNTEEEPDFDEILKAKKLEILDTRRKLDQIWVTNEEKENGAGRSSQWHHWNLPLLREFESQPEKLGHIDFVQKLVMLVEDAYDVLDIRVLKLVTSVLKKAYYSLPKRSDRLVIMEYYYQTYGTQCFVSRNDEFSSDWRSLLNNKITSSVEGKPEYAVEIADELSWFCMMDVSRVVWQSFVLAARNKEALSAIVVLFRFLKPIGFVRNPETGNLFIMDTIKRLITEEIVKPTIQESETADNFIQLISTLCRTHNKALDIDLKTPEERSPLVHPNDIIHQLIIPGMKKVEWRGIYVSLLIKLISNGSTKIAYDSHVDVPSTTRDPGIELIRFMEIQAATKVVERKKEYWEITKPDVVPDPLQPGTMERKQSGSKGPKWIVPSANDKSEKPQTIMKIRSVKKVELGSLLIIFVGYLEMEKGVGIRNSETNAAQLMKACKVLAAEIGKKKLKMRPEAMRQINEKLSKLTSWEVKFLLLDFIPELILAASGIKAQVPECLLKRTSRETQTMFQAICCSDNGKRHAQTDCIHLSLLELITADGTERVLWFIEQGKLDLRSLQLNERWAAKMTQFLLRWRPEHMQGILKVLAVLGIDVTPVLTLADALLLALSTREEMGWSWRECESVIGQYCVAAKEWMEKVVRNAETRDAMSEKSIPVILNEIEGIINKITFTYNRVFAGKNLPNNLLILKKAVDDRKRALSCTGTNARKRYEAGNW